MSSLSIENAAASTAAAVSRAASIRFAADERSVDSFDEQLRNALESESSRRASQTDGKSKFDKAVDKAVERKDRDKAARSSSSEESEVDAAAEESPSDCPRETTDAQAAENPDEKKPEAPSDENGGDADDPQAVATGAQAVATIPEEAELQKELSLLEPESSGEISQIAELQGESSTVLTAVEATDATNSGEQTGEAELGDASLQGEGEAQDAAASGDPNELSRKEAAQENNDEVADADGDAVVQNVAAVAEGEGNQKTKRSDSRRDSSQQDAKIEAAEVQTPAQTQSAAASDATFEAEAAALEEINKPAADTFKSTPGEAKTAAVQVNPAETALGQRLADAREGRATATQADAGDANAALDRAKFVQRVAKAFEGMGNEGGTLRIRLHPDELGSLRLEVAVRDGALTARMETDTAEAKNILLDNLPALRERLAGQNIKVERFDVDYSGGNPDGASRDAGDYQDSGQRAYARPRDVQARGNEDGSAEKVSAAISARRPGGKSQLDFVA